MGLRARSNTTKRPWTVSDLRPSTDTPRDSHRAHTCSILHPPHSWRSAVQNRTWCRYTRYMATKKYWVDGSFFFRGPRDRWVRWWWWWWYQRTGKEYIIPRSKVGQGVFVVGYAFILRIPIHRYTTCRRRIRYEWKWDGARCWRGWWERYGGRWCLVCLESGWPVFIRLDGYCWPLACLVRCGERRYLHSRYLTSPTPFTLPEFFYFFRCREMSKRNSLAECERLQKIHTLPHVALFVIKS